MPFPGKHQFTCPRVELIWHVLKDIQKELFLYIHFAVILTMLGKKQQLNMVV